MIDRETKWKIYHKMINDIPMFESLIRKSIQENNATLLSKSIDIFVQDEEKHEFFVDYEYKTPKTGYHRVYNYHVDLYNLYAIPFEL